MSQMEQIDNTEETWEIQIPGGVHVWKRNRRTGEYEQVRVHGTKGPKHLRISTDDRLYNSEIAEGADNALHDPFQNGSLTRIVDGKKTGELTDDALIEYFEVGDEDAFRELIGDIDNELTARRLLDLAQTKGTVMHVDAIRDLIEDRWKRGGTQKTVQEMFDEGESKGESVG